MDHTRAQPGGEPQGESAPSLGLRAEGSRARVLIVDDSADVHHLLRARLKNDELDFGSAYDDAQGFQLAVEWQPELMLLDIAMPEEEGLALLKKLKEDPRTRAIPVIIVSGHSGPRHKVQAFDLGAVDYIVKPFELIELRARIRSALRMHTLINLLAQRAQIDGLTGLWNRAFFERRWREEWQRSQRHAHALSVAMLDIDHFKSVNDNYGHPAGDAVLEGVARVLLRECRQTDFACRYGGEEFSLMMPDTSAMDAAVVCERIRVAVSELRWPRTPDLRVTISVGVVGGAGATRLTPEEWIEIADKNLYAAKRSGRDRVSTTDLASGVALPHQLRAAG